MLLQHAYVTAIASTPHVSRRYVPVHDAAMSRNDVPEVLDLKGAFEAGGEKSAERPNDGGEQGHEQSVQEEGVEGHRLLNRYKLEDWLA